MNETRDLMIGIDIGRKYSQICYYDRKAEEPRSIPAKVGSSRLEIPTVMCRRPEHEDYCIGLEAEYFAREKGGMLLEDLYEISKSTEERTLAGEQKKPWELLAAFLHEMLRFPGVVELVKNTRCLAVTMESLDAVQIENLEKACKCLGFKEGQYLFLDHEESFYYYVMTQKIETWNRSVGWFAFDRNRVTFRRMTLESGTRPVPVRLEAPVSTELREEAAERDSDFLAFIEQTLGTDLFSSIQISGEGFDQEWAVKSVKRLCWQRRKVFYGNNLFVCGACASAAERFVNRKLGDYCFMGGSLVLTDVGMDMRIMGAPAYYPLIQAGKNWYECRNSCELILDDTEELVFVVSAMGSTEKKKISMALPGLPKRPNKTTRLAVELKYISREECRITVTDLGFGDMFPASGRVWRETARW